MCDVATAVAAVSIGSGLLGAVGQYEQGRQTAKATRASAEYNAQVAANEAATQRQLAQNEIAKGQAEKSQQQRAALRAMGSMRAGMGASGFEMDTGSNLSLLAESAAEHQYDSSVIESNAAQAAWQHQVAATNALNNQSFANWQASNANSGMLGTWLGMGGSLLGGIGTGIYQYNMLNSVSGESGKYTAGDTFRKNAGKSQYTQYGF